MANSSCAILKCMQLIFLTFICFFCEISSIQSQSIFRAECKYIFQDMLYRKISEGHDSSIISLGVAKIFLPGVGITNFPTIMKTDKFGNYVWHKNFQNDSANADADQFFNFLVSADNHIYITGVKFMPWLGNAVLILKLDSVGNFVWGKSFANQYDGENGISILELPDKNLAIGFSNFGGNYFKSTSGLMVIDNGGNIIWHRKYTSVYSQSIKKMVRSVNNGYIISGEFYTDTVTPFVQTGFFVMEVDSVGNIKWQRAFTTNPASNNIAKVAAQLSDKSIFMYGGAFRIQTNTFHPLVMKLDSAGNPLITKFLTTFNNGDVKDMVQNKHGTFYAATTTGPNIFELDNALNIVSTKTLGYAAAYPFCSTADDGLSFAGNAGTLCKVDSSLNEGCYTKPIYSANPTLLMLDTISINIIDTGIFNFIQYHSVVDSTYPLTYNILCNTSTAYQTHDSNQHSKLKVSPNPVGDLLNIIGAINSIEIEKLSFHNIMGQMIEINTMTSTKNVISINVKVLPPGMYFISVLSNNQLQTIKFIKL